MESLKGARKKHKVSNGKHNLSRAHKSLATKTRKLGQPPTPQHSRRLPSVKTTLNISNKLGALWKGRHVGVTRSAYRPRDKEADAMDSDSDVTPEPVSMMDVFEPDPFMDPFDAELSGRTPKKQRERDTVASGCSDKTTRLYQAWESILPSLTESYLELSRGAVESQTSTRRRCTITLCPPQHRQVLLVDFLGCQSIDWLFCDHDPLGAQLIRAGYFPSAPAFPTFAFSINYLELYYHQFEHAADSAQSAAAALTSFHRSRGFVRKDARGKVIHEGYHRPLQYALQWFDVLLHAVELDVDMVLRQYRRHLGANPQLAADPSAHTATLEGVSERLKELCPACFDCEAVGRSHDQGADFHVAMDLNFLQRHSKKAGDCPPINFEFVFMIPAESVASVERKLAAARPRQNPLPSDVPDAALNACEDAHTAADPNRHKTGGREFDDKGVAAMVCRHDIALCWINVDTPGESQKYVFSCIEWLFQQIPDVATVVMVYDIGCVVDRTCNKIEILAPGVRERLRFATSAMHSYAHQWSCQIRYSPRMMEGMGLTDGEGTERHWSRSRGMIPITRHVSRRRRPILIERQYRRFHLTLRERLPLYITHRRKLVRKRLSENQAALDVCGHSVEFLRMQWDDQIRHQTSVRAHFSLQNRRILKQISHLHDAIVRIEERIERVSGSIDGQGPRGAASRLRTLRMTHGELMSQCDELWDAMRVDDENIGLRDYHPKVAALVLHLRDLRGRLSMKLVGQYTEWQQIDRAVGGKEIPTGTALHQRTRSSIKKRHRAIRTIIVQHNQVRADLLEREPNFPTPDALDTSNYDMRDDADLLQEMYMAEPGATIPPWVTDQLVRDGIRALHHIDRCLEEDARLDLEQRNILSWIARQRAAIALAMGDNDNTNYFSLLRRETIRLDVMESDLHFYAHLATPCHPGRPVRPAPPLAPGSPLGVRDAAHMLSPPQSPSLASRRARSVAMHPPSSVSSARTLVAALDALDDNSDDDDSVFGESDEEGGRLDELGLSIAAVTAVRDVLEVADGDSEDEDDDFQLLEVNLVPPPPDPNNPLFIPPIIEFARYTETDKEHYLTHIHRDPKPFAWSDNFQLTQPSIPGERGNVTLNHDAYDRLLNDGWLNDEVMNSAIAALTTLVPTYRRRVVCVATFDLATWAKQSRDAESTYKLCTVYQPWNRQVVLLPVNEAKHWMLVAIYPSAGVVEFFDSMGATDDTARRWCTHAVTWVRCVWGYALGAGAARHARFGGVHPVVPLATEWRFQIMENVTKQKNLLDCGVWVLAQIEAHLRGFRVVAWKEHDMPAYRRWLALLLFKKFPAWTPTPA